MMNNSNYLDRIRNNYDKKSLEAIFDDMCKNNRAKALQYINAENISFPGLYALMPMIKQYEMTPYLNMRNTYAMEFARVGTLSTNQKSGQRILFWMVSTSWAEEGIDYEFERIIDNAAAQLIVVYQDKMVLPTVADLIFARNRKGGHIHDLVWSLFQSKDSTVMPLVANYIKSENPVDNKLASKLLNFKVENQPTDKNVRYENFHKWWGDNNPFLYFAEDGMQQTNTPKYFRVDLSAKYLNIPANTANTVGARPVMGQMQNRMAAFNELSRPEQKTLANYSHSTYKTNGATWNSFVKQPLIAQLEQAKKGGAL